jgi:hypothetical protein
MDPSPMFDARPERQGGILMPSHEPIREAGLVKQSGPERRRTGTD